MISEMRQLLFKGAELMRAQAQTVELKREQAKWAEAAMLLLSADGQQKAAFDQVESDEAGVGGGAGVKRRAKLPPAAVGSSSGAGKQS